MMEMMVDRDWLTYRTTDEGVLSLFDIYETVWSDGRYTYEIKEKAAPNRVVADDDQEYDNRLADDELEQMLTEWMNDH